MKLNSIIRFANEHDILSMLAIYAPYVQETTVSFELSCPDEAEFARRMAERTDKFPWLVCERGEAVAGYAYAGRLGQRPGYDFSAEVSVYVASHFRGAGVGAELYGALLALLAAQGYCEAYALVAAPNPESEAFHLRQGFRPQGSLTRAGRKFGKVVAVSYYAKTLFEDDGNPPPIQLLSQLDKEKVARILSGTGAG